MAAVSQERLARGERKKLSDGSEVCVSPRVMSQWPQSIHMSSSRVVSATRVRWQHQVGAVGDAAALDADVGHGHLAAREEAVDGAAGTEMSRATTPRPRMAAKMASTSWIGVTGARKPSVVNDEPASTNASSEADVAGGMEQEREAEDDADRPGQGHRQQAQGRMHAEHGLAVDVAGTPREPEQEAAEAQEDGAGQRVERGARQDDRAKGRGQRDRDEQEADARPR